MGISDFMAAEIRNGGPLRSRYTEEDDTFYWEPEEDEDEQDQRETD